MKLKWGIFLASAVFSSMGFSSSSVCTSASGTYVCENGQVDNIEGPFSKIEIKNVEITNSINGAIAAINIEESKINKMKGVFAAVRIFNTKFSDKIEGVFGVILFEDSVVPEFLARSATTVLDNSKIEKITLSSAEKETKIILKNKSLVSGDITFNENFGHVCIDDSSELKGKVINGKVIKGEC